MRENALAKLLNISKDQISIFVAKADGDCLYACISKVIDNVTINEMRNIVANNLTQEIYDTYKAICEFSDELIWIRRCKCLEDAKELLRIQKLVWADEFAIKTIIESFDITLFVINEGNRESSTSYDRIGFGSIHIILNRTRRSHYNLITFTPNINDEERMLIYNEFTQRMI